MTPGPATLGEAVRRARRRFAEAGLPSPDLDARWLLAHALDRDERRMMLEADAPLASEEAALVEAVIARRLAGEPVDRILGEREFWGLPFRLSPETLSPRPDTETLVEAALAALAGRGTAPRILDLGTGSGAILVALLHDCHGAFGIGVDRSEGAARQARANAVTNGVGSRAAVLVGDWDAGLDGRFDLVVSNPPYIATCDLAGLDAEVREHDPRLALDGGADGLDAYRRVVAAAARLLVPGGVAVIELGIGQEEAVAALAGSAGLVVGGPARRDLGGVPRALVLHRAR
jgi:release factor glutamine methyltransferase